MVIKDTHDSDAMAHGVSGQVGAESCANAATVTVRTGNLAPDGADGGLLVASRVVLLGLTAVHVHAPLADVEQDVLAVAASFNLQQSVLLVLVAEPTLVAGEHSLGPQTAEALLRARQVRFRGAQLLRTLHTGTDRFRSLTRFAVSLRGSLRGVSLGTSLGLSGGLLWRGLLGRLLSSSGSGGGISHDQLGYKEKEEDTVSIPGKLSRKLRVRQYVPC
uniref:Uncharacterized protein n=1 Tax=Anopheles merus TaxID=30066 RepID=A0A182UQ81_ANOME